MGKLRPSDFRHPLRAALRDQREQQRLVASASKFALSGLSVSAEGVTTVDGDLVVEGDFTATGKVSNGALVDPIVSAQYHDDATNFAVPPGAGAVILSRTITVPAGYTRALILNLTIGVTARNSTASTDFLYATGRVNGSAVGWQIGSQDVLAGKYGVAYDISSRTLTGLSSTFLLEGVLSTATATWAATSTNVANMDAAVLFLR